MLDRGRDNWNFKTRRIVLNFHRSRNIVRYSTFDYFTVPNCKCSNIGKIGIWYVYIIQKYHRYYHDPIRDLRITNDKDQRLFSRKS